MFSATTMTTVHKTIIVTGICHKYSFGEIYKKPWSNDVSGAVMVVNRERWSESRMNPHENNIAPWKQGREQDRALTTTDKASSSTTWGRTVSVNIDDTPWH
jgi:hypothetical protein